MRSGMCCEPERFFLTYRKLRKTRAISRSGEMNPPSLSLAGRDEALLESAMRRNAFLNLITFYFNIIL
jgi:hypothetical protein